MIYINFFIYSFYNFVLGFYANLFMNREKDWKHKIVNAFVWFFVLLIPSIIKFNMQTDTLAYEIVYYSAVVLYFVLGIVLFDKALWKKILFSIFLLTIQAASEMVVFSINSLMGITIEVDFLSFQTTLYVIETILITISILTVIYFVNGIIKKRNNGRVPGIWTVVLLPLNTFLIMEKIVVFSNTRLTHPIFGSIAYAFTLVMDVALLVVIFRQHEKQAFINEIEGVQAQIEEEKQQIINLEKQYDRLAKIRHDKRNEMSLIAGLLETENTDEALRVCERAMKEE